MKKNTEIWTRINHKQRNIAEVIKDANEKHEKKEALRAANYSTVYGETGIENRSIKSKKVEKRRSLKFLKGFLLVIGTILGLFVIVIIMVLILNFITQLFK